MIKKLTKYSFDRELLEILVCPISKKKLFYDKTNNILISKSINLFYPIINGIPVLIKNKAKKIKFP